MASYDPDEVDDEAAEDQVSRESFRDIDAYLIDAQPSMFQDAGIEEDREDGIKKGDTWFGIALKVVRALLKRKIISSPNDQTAVIFYGTRESKNSGTNAFDHVYLYQEMRIPSAKRIRDFETLLHDGRFAEEIGSKAGKSAEHLHHGLFAASQQLMGMPKHSNKTVLIFTNNADPSAGSKPADGDKVKQRVHDLQEQGGKFDLVPMVDPSEGASFLSGSFWRDVLPTLGASQDFDMDPRLPSILQGLLSAVRYKAFKKRPLRSTRLTLGEGFAIGVQLFALIKPAPRAAHVYVSAKDHDLLKTEGADICEDTGAVLTSAQLRKRCFPKQTDTKKMRFPQVFVDIDELEDMRKIVPEGVHVLGFKPIASLKPHHNLREPTMLYPDEKRMPGSTPAFIALHGQMLDQQYLAVATYSTGKFAPKLMALLPIQEVQDEYGAQLEPPGLQMVQLPFSDDIRTPEDDPLFMGQGHPVADVDAVDAAANMIAALALPDFYSGSVANPALQRHYEVLEAKALGEEPPEEPQPDQTLPDSTTFDNAAAAIQAYKTAVYGADFTADIDPKAPKATKRKAAEMGKAEQELADGTDWAVLRAENKLDTLTVVQLKVYLKAHGQPVSGNKGAIISRIEAHLDKAAVKTE